MISRSSLFDLGRRSLRRNFAFFRLAIVTNLEYRLNYLVDAVVQPTITSGVEMVFWYAVFASSGQNLIGGFPMPYYVAYAIWAAFMARLTVNWMYEFRMIEEVESGSINGLLLRPLSFFEYYLSQFLGYKIATTVISLTVPALVTWLFDLPMHWLRLGPALLLAVYYLIFMYLLSFIITTFAFHLNRITGITVAKNLTLWILSGELIPLDLFPEPYRSSLLSLPFANGVFVPVGYLTGRFGPEVLSMGLHSITWGIVITAVVSVLMWRWGLRKYSGTGA